MHSIFHPYWRIWCVTFWEWHLKKDIGSVRHREAVKRLQTNYTYKYNSFPFSKLISRHLHQGTYWIIRKPFALFSLLLKSLAQWCQTKQAQRIFGKSMGKSFVSHKMNRAIVKNITAQNRTVRVGNTPVHREFHAVMQKSVACS